AGVATAGAVAVTQVHPPAPPHPHRVDPVTVPVPRERHVTRQPVAEGEVTAAVLQVHGPAVAHDPGGGTPVAVPVPHERHVTRVAVGDALGHGAGAVAVAQEEDAVTHHADGVGPAA